MPNSGWQSVVNDGENCLLAIVDELTAPVEQYRLDYTFTVPSGVTTVYVFAEVDVNGSGGDDSFWVKMNGSQQTKWNNIRVVGDGWRRSWVFYQGLNSQQSFSVSPGTNTLNLYPRETGAHINWLVVTTDENTDIENYVFGGGAPPPDPVISVTPGSLSFSAVEGGSNPSSQSITVTNSGGGTLSWSASEQPNETWMSLTNTSGGSGDQVTVSVDISGLSAGTYNGTVRISDAAATNDPVDVPMTLTIGSNQPVISV